LMRRVYHLEACWGKPSSQVIQLFANHCAAVGCLQTYYLHGRFESQPVVGPMSLDLDLDEATRKYLIDDVDGLSKSKMDCAWQYNTYTQGLASAYMHQSGNYNITKLMSRLVAALYEQSDGRIFVCQEQWACWKLAFLAKAHETVDRHHDRFKDPLQKIQHDRTHAVVFLRLILSVAETSDCAHPHSFRPVLENTDGSGPCNNIPLNTLPACAASCLVNDAVHNVSFTHGVDAAQEDGKRVLFVLDFTYDGITFAEGRQCVKAAWEAVLGKKVAALVPL
jgi:hypothetical protein